MAMSDKQKNTRNMVGLGVAIGVAIGAATGDMGLWLAIGVAIGAGLSAKQKKNPDD